MLPFFETILYHLSLLHRRNVIDGVTSRYRWLLLSLAIVTIIRTCNYDHVIVIVINARWRARRIGIVLRWMMIGREADELCYVMYMFYSLLLAIYYGCSSRRSEYDTAPDKMKIKDDVTELWSLFIRHQRDGLPPIFISFSGIIENPLIRYAYCA